jgi:ATP-dependent RNA helicase RhlE
MLVKSGIKAEAIHGNKSQNARQRALSNFKDRQIRVLVASDIASRGIDIEEISCVINFEIPNIPETYIHRIGRTGRAGSNGIALSFCDTEERAYLKDIQKLISKTIPVMEDHPYPSSNTSPVELQPSVKANNSSRPNPGGNSRNNKRRWQGFSGRKSMPSTR